MKKSLALSRIILILLATIIIVPSCKKDKGDDNSLKAGTISFKANGELKTYDVSMFNTFQDGNDYVCYLFASMGDNEQSFVSLRITSSHPIAQKSYVNDTGDDRDILVHETSGKEYTDDDDQNTIINITKISDDNIQGTFSGTLTNANETITVTEGKFNCPKLM